MATGERFQLSQDPQMTILMHTLFTLEDLCGLRVCKCSEEVHLEVDSSQSEDAAILSCALTTWWEKFSEMAAGRITREEYKHWRSHYTATGERFQLSQDPRMTILMEPLFTLEDCYGLRVCKCSGKVHLEVDSSQSEDAATLSRVLIQWWLMFSATTEGILKKESYDIWRYHYTVVK